MLADFVANDFAAIARAMRRETASQAAVLLFRDMFGLLSSTHESVDVAIERAYVLVASDTGIPIRITTTDGAVLMDTAALADALLTSR